MPTTSQTTTYIPGSTTQEKDILEQWYQALQYMLPTLSSMYGAMDPSMYQQYTGIAGAQGQQALQEIQNQQQIQQLYTQMTAAQQGGNTELAQQLQQQIMGMAGGQSALLQNQIYNSAMALGQGGIPQISAEAQAQIQALGQQYETTGLNAVDRAREQALQQWQQNTAQRGLRGTDTPSQAAWAPVEAELLRQQSEVGANRAALESQYTLNFANQGVTNAAQLGAFQQALNQAAQQNRYLLGTQSASPYQSLLSGLGGASQTYNPYIKGGTTTTETVTPNAPWYSQLSGALGPIGSILGGVGQAAPYLGSMFGGFGSTGLAGGSSINQWSNLF